jgi:alkylated DNA nucleotide flippase Atl1
VIISTPPLGPWQHHVAAQLEGAGADGLGAEAMARALGEDPAGVERALRALVRAGLAEPVSEASPPRWRLAPSYRPNASLYAAMAAHVRPGEWTTYGDLSVAVRGDVRGARAVGRAAAAMDGFPNAHRVLREGGRIAPAWVDGRGRGPEECRHRLRREGIRFLGERADPRRRVPWEELLRRSQA